MAHIDFDYVIYHLVKTNTPCPDGIASAWVCKRYNSNAKFIGMSYGDELPELPDNCDVICVDFSFTDKQLDQLRDKNINVVVIDHHVSAFENYCNFSGHLDLLGTDSLFHYQDGGEFIYHYDNNECGATLTWKILFADVPVPLFLKYVKDRDLWQHKLPHTREIHEAVGYLGRTFDTFDYLYLLPEEKFIKTISPIGTEMINKKIDTIKNQICKPSKLITEIIGGYKVIGLELSPYYSRWTSDIAEYLYNTYPEYPFVFCKGRPKPEGIKYSLRSSESKGFDVRTIAEQYGGGGHKHAAGFIKPLNV